MFHGNNLVFVIEFNVFFQCNLFILLLACACIVNLFFLGGIAQYGSKVPFCSFHTAKFFFFSY